MSFKDTMALLPTTSTTADATGFMPPFLRTMGHILFVLGHVADENTTVPDDDLLQELTHAHIHWTSLHKTNLSTPAQATIDRYTTGLAEALAEWRDWDRDTRINALRTLANASVGISAQLDRELVGLLNSQPGHNL